MEQLEVIPQRYYVHWRGLASEYLVSTPVSADDLAMRQQRFKMETI